MENTLSTIVFGTLGGLVRALVGVVKHFQSSREERRIRFGYLAFSLFVAALVGGVAGAVADGDWRMAIIAGYAGTDFLEGLYKIKKRQGFEI